MDDTVLNLTNEYVDVLWKDPLVGPNEHLTNLEQFAGAYATATIDRATKVQLLLKQREDKIQELERLLEQEKFNSNRQMELKISQFQKDFEILTLQHQVKLTEKEMQVEAAMNKLKIQPQVELFIREALEMNEKIKQQQEIFCQQV